MKDVNTDTMTCEFKHLGIQCVTKKNFQESLNNRIKNGIDPFGTGFQHSKEQFNSTQLRLAFQVFLKPQGYQDHIDVLHVPVTQIIKCSNAHGDLKIVDCSANTAPFEGKLANLFHPSQLKLQLQLLSLQVTRRSYY